MKSFLKKLAACSLLVIYAINPLHSVLHCDHSDDHKCSMHSDSPTAKKLEKSELTLNLNHDCFLCQNSQDKTHYLTFNSDASDKEIKTPYLLPKAGDSIYVNQFGFFVESRGPPALL